MQAAGVKDLKTGRVSASRVGVQPGTSMAMVYARDFSSVFYPVRDVAAGFAALEAGAIDVFMSSEAPLAYGIATGHCGTEIVGEIVSPINYGLVFPTGSPYVAQLQPHLLQLQERGVVASLYAKYWQRDSCNDGGTPRAVGTDMTDLAGVFVFLAISIGFALMIWAAKHWVTAWVIASRETRRAGESTARRAQCSLAMRVCARRSCPSCSCCATRPPNSSDEGGKPEPVHDAGRRSSAVEQAADAFRAIVLEGIDDVAAVMTPREQRPPQTKDSGKSVASARISVVNPMRT